MPNAIIYIVGCKCDLKSEVATETVQKYYGQYLNYLTSAKNDINVGEVFCMLEQELLHTVPKTIKSPTRRTLFKSEKK